ncbi:hypothetical protein NQ318_005605 [Aromia moschata]|uniref:Aquaporin n=1 Tax=Aromia moschata TaxID=1265417 RepID=A0AAV8XT53_9CUCU|nr:hypothetical protein NQ318_005605 [Aromia moschata]
MYGLKILKTRRTPTGQKAPFTAAALNPARSLPPSLLNNHWDYHWIYHLGPFLGAIIAAFLYRFIFEETEKYSLYKLTQKRK